MKLNRRATLAFLAVSGAASSWPAPGFARGRRPAIGILWHGRNTKEEARPRGYLMEGFSTLGYKEGKNLWLEERFANEEPALFPGLAAELVALKLDVLIASSIPSVLALQRATSTIPIVFIGNPDPVGMKLVASLAQPGGNLTGTSSQVYDIEAKRIQLLHEALPRVSKVAMLVNPAQNPYDPHRLSSEVKPAADRFGLTIQTFEVRRREELAPVVSSIEQNRLEAIIVTQNALFYVERAEIAALAEKSRLPTIAPMDVFVEAGILLSYGPSFQALYRNTPATVDKILKGMKPGNIPVEQPTQFQLAVNLHTAHRIGVELSPTFLARADSVIEQSEPASVSR